MSIINNVLSKVVGSRHARVIKKFTRLVAQVNSFEKGMQALDDDELKAKTQQFRERLDKEDPIEDILPEAFAVVREASQRALGERHYDVQLIGGMVLNEGCISEMGTGEGKTLVATLPAYINALSGKGVHIVTVNDYLAKRDAEWMGKVFNFLGLEVGVVISGMSGEEKKAAYNCDVTYATNNELGFDYLRDNMAFSEDQKTQKKLNYAIIDEVDSILIDEARTPLVISGPTGDHAEVYIAIDKMIPLFTLQTETGEGKEVVVNIPGDYTLDQKQKQVYLTDDGHAKAEELLINAGALPAAVFYWLPKWTGKMYNETLGKVHFWWAMISVNVLFFPQHFLGLAGMPRRIPDYSLQFADFNYISSIGGFAFGLSFVLFAYIIVDCIRNGKPVDSRPWYSAKGLEWTLPSPPPYHSFNTPPTRAEILEESQHSYWLIIQKAPS